MLSSPEHTHVRNEVDIVRKEKRSPLDMSSMLHTVRELDFDSSADGVAGRGFPHNTFDEVCKIIQCHLHGLMYAILVHTVINCTSKEIITI
jgi:hypothetical protein